MNQNKSVALAGQLYVLLMFTVFPLFINTNYSNITFMKCMIHVVLLALFVVLLLISFIGNTDKALSVDISPKNIFSAKYLPDWCLFLMIVFAFCSCALSPYVNTLNSDGQSLVVFGAGRFDGLLFVFLYALVFWLVSRFGSFGQGFSLLFTATVGVMCVIAIIQMGGNNIFALYPTSSYKGWYNGFVSTIGNVDMMSGFLSMAFPLVWVSYIVFPYNDKEIKSKKDLPSMLEAVKYTDAVTYYKVMQWVFRLLTLAVLGLTFYVGLAIDVDTFKVVAIMLPAIIVPLMLRSVSYAVRLLESVAALLVAFAFYSSVSYVFTKKTAYGSMMTTDVTFKMTKIATICLSVAFVLVVGAVLLRLVKGKNFPFIYLSLAIVAAELIGVVAIVLYFLKIDEPTSNGLFHDMYELVRFRLSDSAGSQRVGIWRNALEMSKENPVFGTGTGTFAISFKKFASEVGYNFYKDKNLDFAHNEYINILCAQGITGLVTYMGFLISSAVLAFKKMSKNPKIYVLGCSVLGYAVQAFFSFSVVIMTPLFWVLIGLLVKEIRNTYASENVKTNQ